MKNVFEKISNRFVSEVEFALLYKIIELINDEPFEFNRKFGTYIANHYLITVTKRRACAKPLYDDFYLIAIKPPRKLTSI